MPHATTVGPFTRSLCNPTTFGQLQDLFRSIEYSFCHISCDETLICFINFPSVIHSTESRWISTQSTGQPESVFCKHFAQMLQLLVTNHSVLVLLLTFLFSVSTAAGGIPSWKLQHGALQP